MTIEEQIRQRRMEIQTAVSDNILKSFESEGLHVNSLIKSEENEFEKAKHQDGDMHPNGKWVWVSSANGGKGDWRTKGGRTHTKHSAAGGNAEVKTDNTQSTNSKSTAEKTAPRSLDEYAAEVSTDKLEQVVSSKNASKELRDAAEKELKKRNGENQQVEKQKLKEQSTESEKHSNMTIYGRSLNFNFLHSLKNENKFSLNVLKEMGYKTQNDRQYDINSTWLSDDSKSLLISFKNKYGKNEDVEIPFDSKSPTLNQLYKEYSEKVAKILDKNVPETLDKKELNEAIGIEMSNFWDNNNTHNDSQEWRENAWQIYSKYNKNNPMSIETFDRKYASAYQGASQGLKMEYYFNARAKGGDAEEAEEYANEQFNAFLRHLDDPIMKRYNFTPTPFK